jgi:hypothetical protein
VTENLALALPAEQFASRRPRGHSNVWRPTHLRRTA